MRPFHYLHMLILLLLVCCMANCSNQRQKETLDRAESLMEAHPDSALIILEGIKKSELASKKEHARYALLMSMALDKNFIDTTKFDVLQPAIDYYLKSGNPTEKLRTYYYQGVIFLNKGDRENALNSFVKGVHISNESEDSLTTARLLVAQGGLYNEFYEFDSYARLYLEAAAIYKSLSIKDSEFDCLLNALNGSILIENQHQCDSILNLLTKFNSLNPTQEHGIQRQQLSYALKFGSKDEIKNLIHIQERNLNSQTDILNLALAYIQTGDYEKANNSLDYVITCGQPYDTIRYLSISVPTLEGCGRYKEALDKYKQFCHKQDSINLIKFEQQVKTVEEKHQIELKAQQDARKNTIIIWSCIGGIIFLVLIVVILFLLFRSNKTQKDLAIEKAKNTELENKQLKTDNDMALQKARITELENEQLKSDKDMALQKARITELENEQLKSDKDKAIQKAKITDLENERLKAEKDKAIQQAKIAELENERLKSEREKLELENKNLQLERDNKALEAENLAHRVETLENESASLKELIDSQEELPSEVQQAIKVRIEMLNALMAGYITDNDRYEKPYETWIKELTDDTEKFMDSNRLAFQASHPRFIQYFEDHGLTVSEINYACLYAIGLKGKEVGKYMNKRSHVNISSGIRKKLGIDKHETNIGIYVRKLLKEL